MLGQVKKIIVQEICGWMSNIKSLQLKVWLQGKDSLLPKRQ